MVRAVNRRAFHGPRVASWWVDYVPTDGRPGATGCADQAGAHWNAAYYMARGYAVTITRTEFCPAPGCDGHGQITRRAARGMVRHVPCVAHVPSVATVEAYEPALARESMARLGYSVRERIALAQHNGIPLALLGWDAMDAIGGAA
jgi:hypothetical protein